MPTIKQKKAFMELGANGGNISKAMKVAGYGKTKSDKLTNSEGWAELLEQYLPDGKLAAKHQKLLNSKKEEIGVKALDMAYKLKGNYAPEKSISLVATATLNLKPETVEQINELALDDK